MIDNYFDITIKDNFFKEKDFKEIYNKLDLFHWSPDNYVKYKNGDKEFAWYQHETSIDVKKIIENEVYNNFNKKIKNFVLSNYTMLNNPKTLVHQDKREGVNWQLLIYLKGDSTIVNGTGFYVHNKEKKEEEYVLNTHIGFKENRAIFFKAGILHSPLQWSGNHSKRYSIINFLNIYN